MMGIGGIGFLDVFRVAIESRVSPANRVARF